MRDQRADALAQILVRYSTQVAEGRRVRDPVDHRRRAAGAGRLRGGAARRRAADHAAHHRAARRPRSSSSPSDEQLDWIPPTARVGGRERRRAHRDHGRRQRARAVAAPTPKKQARAQKARKAADGDLDAARRRGRVPLGAHAVPDARLRERGGHVAARLRGLLLRRLPGRPTATRSPPGSASRTRSSGWPSGSRARRRSAYQARAPTSRSAWPGAHWIPCVGEHNMPDGEFFTGPVEDSVERRDRLLVPGQLRRARGRRACASASRTARSSTPRPSRARTSCSRCSTPTTARAAWASSASAPTTASPPAPRRSCSTRRSAARSTWRSA